MIQFSRYSIRTKIIIIMLTAGLPVVVAASFYLVTKYKAEYDKAELAAISTAQEIAYQHNAQLEGIRHLLITLSHLPEVRNKDGKACTSIIRNILGQSPSSLNIGIADLQGNLIASGVPGKFSIEDRKYFRDALRTKRFSSGEYTVSRAVGKPAIHFGLPVLDASGNPVAVLYATFDLTQFNALFDAQKLPQQSVLNLTDHKGIVIHSYPGHETVKPGVADSPALRRHVTGTAEEGAFVDVGLDHVKRLLAFKRLQLHPDEPPYLYIRVSIPVEVALSDARRFTITAAAIFILSTCLALAAIRFLAGYYFVHPVEQMAAVSQELASGNLSVRTGIPYTPDELGRLAQSFDTMAAALDARLHERDRAEAALKASEEKLHAIFDHMNDAIFIHDAVSGAILDVNQAMCNMFGYDRDEACRQDVEALSLGEQPYTQKEAMEWMTLAIDGHPQLFEWISKRRDGQTFWSEVSMRLATIDGADRLIVLVRDISERKEAEEEKRSLLEQLNQAQRIESIGRLAGGIAHDFNNLLTPIIGYTELVKRDANASVRFSEKLDRIMVAAIKAKELVQQLLSFGRKQMLDMKNIDLNHLISAFADILQRTIRENIRIRLVLADDLESIRADRTHIEQVIMNLVVNAQDAIKDVGCITIETGIVFLDDEYVRNHADAKPGRYVMLAVSDDGCGMDKETMEHIFEPFFTTKAIGEGSGLGLATVHGIIKQHGGCAWIYSEQGKGTVFKLFFPSVRGMAPQCELMHDVAQAPHKAGGTILLVEDNDIVRAIVFELLTGRGYAVIEADSPTRALELAEGRILDLLVTDVVMPEMNGPELHKRLADRQPGLKVIFMSGYTDNVIVQQGDLSEGVSFIQKPFTVTAMENKIAEILAELPLDRCEGACRTSGECERGGAEC